MPRTPAEPRKLMEFLEKSTIVNLEMPLSQIVRGVSELEEVAGYVIAWERYVLVVAQMPELLQQREIGR